MLQKLPAGPRRPHRQGPAWRLDVAFLGRPTQLFDIYVRNLTIPLDFGARRWA